MVPAAKIDRREQKTQALRLGQPLFMQIPTKACRICSGWLRAGHYFRQRTVPAGLVRTVLSTICAFGALFVGNRFAVLLGILVAAIQIMQGHSMVLHSGPVFAAMQFCSALAVVLMLGVARAALEVEWRFARMDLLTGALNRKAFFEAIEREREGPGVRVLIFADVDGLKRLNDRCGHEAGDEALRDFADRTRKAIRKDDIFARIGGDEFALFLAVRNLAEAEFVARRLNEVLNLDFSEGEPKLTCSLGVLALPEGSRSIDSELKQADKLMYRAKKDGVGLTMAIWLEETLHELMPFIPSVNSDGQPRAVIRQAERGIVCAARNPASESSIAA